MVLTILLGLLAALALTYTIVLVRRAAQRRELQPSLEAVGLGAVTNFFDTLGIGSFQTERWK